MHSMKKKTIHRFMRLHQYQIAGEGKNDHKLRYKEYNIQLARAQGIQPMN